MPKITIGVPTYNSENTIVDLLESVRAQSFTDFCIYISDNNSNDLTQEIAKQYTIHDNRFNLKINNENIGSTNNLIRLIDLCETEYFCWLPSDVKIDVFYLEKIINELDIDQSIVGCYAESSFTSGSKNISHSDTYSLMYESAVERISTLIQNLSVGTAVYGVFRTYAMKEIFILPRSGLNPWVDNKVFQFGDLIMLTNMLMYGKIKKINEKLIARKLDENNSGNDLNYWLKYFDKIERYQAINLPIISLPFLIGLVKLKKTILESKLNLSHRIVLINIVDKFLFPKYKAAILGEIDYFIEMTRRSIVNSFSKEGQTFLISLANSEQDKFYLKKISLMKIMFEILPLVVYIDDSEIQQQFEKINKHLTAIKRTLP